MISRGKMSLSIFTICLQHFCVGGHLSQMVCGSTTSKTRVCSVSEIKMALSLALLPNLNPGEDGKSAQFLSA